mmetsp:Transcript_44072/g.107087  ORF Transcript_44072/g.107087 Transcript_44072/m.107087 type:complete len:218 (-) Transcript_44072:783-1436(-)
MNDLKHMLQLGRKAGDSSLSNTRIHEEVVETLGLDFFFMKITQPRAQRQTPVMQAIAMPAMTAASIALPPSLPCCLFKVAAASTLTTVTLYSVVEKNEETASQVPASHPRTSPIVAPSFDVPLSAASLSAPKSTSIVIFTLAATTVTLTLLGFTSSNVAIFDAIASLTSSVYSATVPEVTMALLTLYVSCISCPLAEPGVGSDGQMLPKSCAPWRIS